MASAPTAWCLVTTFDGCRSLSYYARDDNEGSVWRRARLVTSGNSSMSSPTSAASPTVSTTSNPLKGRKGTRSGTASPLPPTTKAQSTGKVLVEVTSEVAKPMMVDNFDSVLNRLRLEHQGVAAAVDAKEKAEAQAGTKRRGARQPPPTIKRETRASAAAKLKSEAVKEGDEKPVKKEDDVQVKTEETADEESKRDVLTDHRTVGTTPCVIYGCVVEDGEEDKREKKLLRVIDPSPKTSCMPVALPWAHQAEFDSISAEELAVAREIGSVLRQDEGSLTGRVTFKKVDVDPQCRLPDSSPLGNPKATHAELVATAERVMNLATVSAVRDLEAKIRSHIDSVGSGGAGTLPPSSETTLGPGALAVSLPMLRHLLSLADEAFATLGELQRFFERYDSNNSSKAPSEPPAGAPQGREKTRQGAATKEEKQRGFEYTENQKDVLWYIVSMVQPMAESSREGYFRQLGSVTDGPMMVSKLLVSLQGGIERVTQVIEMVQMAQDAGVQKPLHS